MLNFFKKLMSRPVQLRKNTVSKRFQPLVESLEDRRLMTTAVLDHGILTITGTNGPDTIVVRQHNNTISIDGLSQTFNAAMPAPSGPVLYMPVNGPAGSDIVVNGTFSTVVQAIVVKGLSGADTINLSVAPLSKFGSFDPIKLPTAIYGGADADTITGGAGRDYIFGEAGGDKLFGVGGDDRLEGGAGIDTLNGGVGSDVYVFAGGALGSDTISEVGGIAGTDRFDFSKFIGAANVDLALITPQIVLTGQLSLTLTSASSIEDVTGSDFGDTIKGNALNNNITGRGGNDTIYGRGGADTLSGNAGRDTLDGGDQDDVLIGGADKDTLSGGTGHDELNGGTGDDTLNGDGGNDRLHGDSGNDTLRGGAGRDFLDGGADNDNLDGGDAADALFGGAGVDTVKGSGGADRFLALKDTPGALGIGMWDPDTIVDLGSSDVRINFENGTGTDVGAYGESAHFSGGTWTEAEIEQVDTAFRILFNQTDNVKLLKKADGGEVTFVRQGHQTNSTGFVPGGWNGNGTITLIDNSFDFGEDGVIETVVHEIGHNWDTESPIADAFKGLSGWKDFFWPWESKDAYTQSDLDPDWYYLTATADRFVSDYATANQYEDFAESFAAYILTQAGVSNFYDTTAGADKMELIGGWVESL